jgi:signal transduction histidine kinase
LPLRCGIDPTGFLAGHLLQGTFPIRMATWQNSIDPKTIERTAWEQPEGDSEAPVRSETYVRGMERLISVVRDLSLARDLPTVCAIVRHAARELTGADGATFVLRDVDRCFYVDEDAIGPLWKGKKFPMSTCISGWAMMNKSHVVVEDIYVDPRIPHDAYRPTFVKSLAMVPIRANSPIGAIGNYWATRHEATQDEVKLLQALADSTSVALENIQVYAELEQRVRERTMQLQAANRDLEAFSYSVSHDLRTPLSIIVGFSGLLSVDQDLKANPKWRSHVQKVRDAATRMDSLINDLLGLAQVTRSELSCETINLADVARQVIEQLTNADQQRDVLWSVAPDIPAHADPRLVLIVLENLLANALKYTGKREDARIEVGILPGSVPVYFVKDNGAGFDMRYADRLFAPFKRLHSEAQFPGTGVGLATVQRIIQKHGGEIWAESTVDQGATFFFTLSAGATSNAVGINGNLD